MNVLTAVENGIATITLNRPEVHNAFSDTVILALTAVCERVGSDDSVRAVVLRGNGKSFCAGGDLNWMRRVADYGHHENVQDALQLGRLLRLVNDMPKVTLALVQGSAFGGGVGLAACCDVVIAEETARFCLSEVRIGLIPSVIAPYVVAAMGARQARRYFMTAERFDAPEAARIGLVHDVCLPGGLDAAAEKILAAVFDGAPGAQAMGKRLILDIAGRPLDDDMVLLTATRIAEARASAEGREGLTAFLNKTEPSWRKNERVRE